MLNNPVNNLNRIIFFILIEIFSFTIVLKHQYKYTKDSFSNNFRKRFRKTGTFPETFPLIINRLQQYLLTIGY